jgi:hypothetical protein
MHFEQVASFDVVQERLSWPWVTIEPNGKRLAFPTSRTRIESRRLEDGAIAPGPSFALPDELALPLEAPVEAPTHDARGGLHAFAIAPDGERLVVTGIVGASSVVVTLDPSGETRRSNLGDLGLAGFVAQAALFERSGNRVWISAESATESALILLDATSHASLGLLKSPPFPPPATHELFVHPEEDAVLLLAACGPDGTFARVARFDRDRLQAVWTSLDGGSISAGMVGFSPDAKSLYLAEADELRTHGWPGLKETSSTQFDDDFVSSYSGAVIGEHVLVDGQDYETKDDVVTAFDVTATKSRLVLPPVPTGMWVGRLGLDHIVTVAAKGTPARGLVMKCTP